MFPLSLITDFPAKIAEKAFDALYDVVITQCKYVIRCNKNVEELHKQLEDYVSPFEGPINDATYGVKKIDAARIAHLNQEEQDNIGGALKLVNEYNQAYKNNRLRFCGCIPNPISRRTFGKEASEWKDTIQKLHETNPDGLTIPKKPPGMQPPDDAKNYYLPKSRDELVNRIIEALQDPDIQMIGLWGAEKMGKGILSKKLVERVLEEKWFDIRAESEITDDVEKIQDDLLSDLTVDAINQTAGAKQKRQDLSIRLTNNEDEKVLIILRKLSSRIDLNKVGIPLKVKDSKKICKVILMSADRNLLLKEMGVRQENLFCLGELSDVESIDLFQNTIEKELTNNRDKKAVMDKLVKECNGLPHVIVQQANNLKNEDAAYVWEDALKKMRSENNQMMQDHVDSILNLKSNAKKTRSNSHLEELRSLIYLCGLIGEPTISVQDLVIHGRGMSLFGGDATVVETRNHVNSLLKELREANLVGGNEKVVKIKGRYNGVFTSIRSDRHPFIVRSDDAEGSSGGPNKRPDEEELGNCTEMSIDMVDDSYVNLTEKWMPKCPKMKMLLLRQKDGSEVYSHQISIGFFTSLNELTVLHLTNIDFSFSPHPSSVNGLINLKTLRLECCRLREVRHIGDLKTLHHLSFSGSDIDHLPKALGKLTDLRLLDLRRCHKLQQIESGALESLTNLEELYLDDSFSDWELSHQGANPHGNGRNKASLDELNGMNKLTALQFHVPDATKLPIKLSTMKLERYRIKVGDNQNFSTDSVLSLQDSSTGVRNSLPSAVNENTQHIPIPETTMLPENQSVEKPENYNIALGNASDFSDGDHENERTLKLSLTKPSRGYNDFLNTEWIQHTLKRCKNLYLRGEIEDFGSIGELPSDGFPELEHLHVQDSPTIECIIKNISVHAFQNLVSLTLADLTNLTNICRDNPDSLSFENLKVLKIQQCCRLEFLVKPHFVQGTRNLQEIEVTGCEKIKGIVEDEKENRIIHKTGTENKVEWPSVHHLTLRKLDELMSFIFTKRTEGESSGSTSSDTSTAFFDDKRISLPALKSLEIFDLPRVEEIWLPDLPPADSGNLQHLHVECCESLQRVIKDNHLAMLQKLKSLTIKNCPLVKEAFQLEPNLPPSLSLQHKSEPEPRDLAPGLFSRRRVEKEQKTANAGHGSNEIVVLSNLVQLKLINLQSLEYMWKSSPGRTARFQNLSQLTVQGCGKLRHVFSVTMARGLPQLWHLCIENCEMLEVVVTQDTKNEEPKLEFKMLTSLSLENLQSLTRFSRGIDSVSFPSLKILRISNCPRPTAFYNALSPYEQLQKALYNADEDTSEAMAMITTVLEIREEDFADNASMGESPIEGLLKERALFEQKVSSSFPSLENLAFSKMELRNIWQGQASEESFPELSQVSVEDCGRLTHVFHQNMLQAFLNIQSLRISNCSSLEMILAVPRPTDEEQIENDKAAEFEAQLKNLFLKKLNNLEHIWPAMDSNRRIITFANLELVSVGQCKSIEYLFPASMIKHLSKLERLKVKMCDGLEQLIQDDDPMRVTNRIKFRYLKSLRLQKLQNLENLYSKQHVSRWPSLKKLMVTECDKVKIFASPGRDFSASNQCLFWIDQDSFRVLEELELNQNKLMTKIWQGQLSEASFDELRVFKLVSSMGQPAVFPLGFLQRSAYLEKLEVSNFHILESQIEQSAGVHEERETLQTRLPQSHPVIFKKLQLNMVLDMQHLDEGLTLMGASTDYFHGLTSLDVSKCDHLKYLLTINMAESLPHLKRLTVMKCNHMEEIVAGETSRAGAQKNVTLRSLKCLTLDSLPNIKCFSAGMSIIFHYSSLEEVIVAQCPKLEKFTEDNLQAPKLVKVKIQGKEKILSKYSYNLNDVIKASYAEMDAFPGMENVNLHEFPDWTKKWDNLPIVTPCSMRNLDISNCTSLSHAVPSKLMHLLGELRKLRVSNCDGIVSVFDAPDDSQNNGMLLPELYGIHLTDLPELKHIWTPHHFPGMSNLQKLQYLEVQGCNSLKSIFTLRIALSLPLLKRLTIKHCRGVKYIISSDDHERLTNKTVIFPQLEYLFLVSLDSLESFHEDYPHIHCPSFSAGMSIVFHYSSLTEVIVAQCPKLEKFTKDDLEAPKLKEVKIEGKEKILSMYDYNLNDVIKASYAEMDAFTGMENVKLHEFPDWTKKWDNLPIVTSCSMRNLDISNCTSLSHAVPSKLIHLLAELRKLQVSNCDGIVAVFDAPDDSQNNGMLLPELCGIHLTDLPELMHIWMPHHFPGMSNWQNLQHLEVQGCNSLKSIFTLQVALSLPLLEKLTIKYCTDVKYVISSDDHERLTNEKYIISSDGHERLTNETVIFPQLEYLFLISLPCLESFHVDYPIIHCPSLKYILVEECRNAKGIHEMCTAPASQARAWPTEFICFFSRLPKYILVKECRNTNGIHLFLLVFTCLSIFSYWIHSL